MSTLTLLGYYFADLWVFGALLLGMTLAVWPFVRESANRVLFARGTFFALAAFAVLLVLPGWPRVSLLLQPPQTSGPSTLASRLPTEQFPTLPEPQANDPAAEQAGEADIGSVPASETIAVSPSSSETEPAPALAPIAVAPQARMPLPLSGEQLMPLFGLTQLLAIFWAVSRILFGLVRTRRLCIGSTPLDDEQAIGSSSASVRLRITTETTIPVVLGFAKPNVLIPAGFLGDPKTLHDAVNHELAHVRHGDLKFLAFSQLLFPLFVLQPLYHLLCRAVRDEQELLADAAVLAETDRMQYAEELLCWARAAAESKLRPIALGLGLWEFSRPFFTLFRKGKTMTSKQTSLTRRIEVLLSETVPRRLVGTRAAKCLSGVLLPLLVLGLSFLTISPQFAETVAPQPEKAAAGESREYFGHIREVKTSKPIEGAKVVVQLWDGPPLVNGIGQSDPAKCLEETVHQTDAEGIYRYRVSAELAANPNLYVKVMADHHDYLCDGYNVNPWPVAVLSMKKEQGDTRFGNLSMLPAKWVSGTIVDPEGKPVYPCQVGVFWLRFPDLGIYSDRYVVATDQNGHFASKVVASEKVAFKITPANCAPLTYFLEKDDPGEVGTLTVPRGQPLRGRTLDTEGKPVAGVLVIVREKPVAEKGFFPQCLFSRSAVSDAEGYFATQPLMPGYYEMSAGEFRMNPGYEIPPEISSSLSGIEMLETLKKEWEEDNKPKNPNRVEIPGIFPPMLVDFDGTTSIEYKATILRTISFSLQGEEGKSFEGPVGIYIIGTVDYQVWRSSKERIAKAGKPLSIAVPHGLQQGLLMLHTSLGHDRSHPMRYRLKKGDVLWNDWAIDLGAHYRVIEEDIDGLEIMPYRPGHLTVLCTDENGEEIASEKSFLSWYVSLRYDRELSLYRDDGSRFGASQGFNTCDFQKTVRKNETTGEETPSYQYEFYTLAGLRFTLTAEAYGKEYEQQEKFLTLKDGEERTVTFRLKKETSEKD